MALRVAILGGIAFVAFGIIFFRLWFLQVLTGEDYVVQARENRVRKVRVEAPRGEIVDRKDRPLVSTREAPVVQVDPSMLPVAAREAAIKYQERRSKAELKRLKAKDQLRDLLRERRAARGPEGRRKPLTAAERKVSKDSRAAEAKEISRLRRASRVAAPVAVPPLPDDARLRDLYARLGDVLDMSSKTIHKRVTEGIAEAPYANVTVDVDVDREAYNFLFERAADFPGVRPTSLYLRQYRQGEIGSHLFGRVGEISPEERKLERFSGVQEGTKVGKDGIELVYDRYLQGTPGWDSIGVDAQGQRDQRRGIKRREPRQGNRLRLTLDMKLQRSGHKIMERVINTQLGGAARAGSFVALSPETGEVYAMGSFPSFDADIFAKPLSQDDYDALVNPELGAPLVNRAISPYPTGSTFKPISALAALESGKLQPNEVINDPGYFDVGDRKLKNARDAVFGPVDLTKALQVSSDVFFYKLGARMNNSPAIQSTARDLGFGEVTGIDLPGEQPGLVPDAKWRNREHAKYSRCVKKAKLQPGTVAALVKCGGVERPWSLGDNVHLAIGQGDLLASPLQMAVSYSALFNDSGRLVQPHLAAAVEDGEGRIVQELQHPPTGQVKIDDRHQGPIREGLRRAAMEPGGTSYGVFGDFKEAGLTVYGKTGTVERAGAPADDAWYAAYVPHKTRPIVVVVSIEQGGFGSETAAPVARELLSSWFNLDKKGFETTRTQAAAKGPLE